MKLFTGTVAVTAPVRGVDERDEVAPSRCLVDADVGGPAVGRERDELGRSLGDLDGPGHQVSGRVEHGDRACAWIGDVGELAVRRDLDVAGGLPDRYLPRDVGRARAGALLAARVVPVLVGPPVFDVAAAPLPFGLLESHEDDHDRNRQCHGCGQNQHAKAAPARLALRPAGRSARWQATADWDRGQGPAACSRVAACRPSRLRRPRAPFASGPEELRVAVAGWLRLGTRRLPQALPACDGGRSLPRGRGISAHGGAGSCVIGGGGSAAGASVSKASRAAAASAPAVG